MIVTCIFSPPVFCIPRLVCKARSIFLISATVTLPICSLSLLLHTVTICSQRAIDGLRAEFI
nr:MAG TPA: hypothetical protein [Caudoviricetes sp.]